MSNHRDPTPPTIAEIQQAWAGVRTLELTDHKDQAIACNKVVQAFMDLRKRCGAPAYPDVQTS